MISSEQKQIAITLNEFSTFSALKGFSNRPWIRSPQLLDLLKT
jgi:hypothetical protein